MRAFAALAMCLICPVPGVSAVPRQADVVTLQAIALPQNRASISVLGLPLTLSDFRAPPSQTPSVCQHIQHRIDISVLERDIAELCSGAGT
jgi:hypothetical protein